MKKEVWTTLLVLVFLVSVSAQTQSTAPAEYGSYRLALININTGANNAAGNQEAMTFYEGLRKTLDRGGGLIYVKLGSPEQSYLQLGNYGDPLDRYRVVDGTVEKYSWFNDIYSDGWVSEDTVTPANLGAQQISYLPGSIDGGQDYELTANGEYCPV
ncbi:hypothetical protein JXB27_03100 [Candidatus Woesearchaeota archaeon]|nr:hypothetical protein [Candidatus Woesearchaeota archaeon]